ncbi:hypothetical protein [Nitrococcus mobilis]|uniref:ATP-dependent DNA helicase, UvrD/REP family protein n=1 Tax=Nitrococcus mobilis Nb-231 TaxID=314278 RepID=A4BRB0_9GAMM|nr:hypothetical protein [Nitrococcus mobilis]EAR21732.1 ATP-dependent DNA helicase, UvrD/REP family protein [Nitrococcus mobilis Nb-231]
MLSQSNVDLGHAGCFAAKQPVHRTLSQVSYGDELALVITGERRELRTLQGVVVGKLARKAVLPSGRVTQVTVESVMHWSRLHTDPDHHRRLRVDEWWMVLPRLVIKPEGDFKGGERI